MTVYSWQSWITMVLVAAAIAYVARNAWRMLKAKSSGCGDSCQCDTGEKANPPVKRHAFQLPMSPSKVNDRR
jgi:hypothetical protein